MANPDWEPTKGPEFERDSREKGRIDKKIRVTHTSSFAMGKVEGGKGGSNKV